MTNTIVVKIGTKLYDKLNKIKEQERKRGREETSYAAAGEILSDRIDEVGGIKELP